MLEHILIDMGVLEILERVMNNTEAIVIIALALVGSWVQTNVRITTGRERGEAMKERIADLEKDYDERLKECDADRKKLWERKSDKEVTNEMKRDFQSYVADMKNDLNKRLDDMTKILQDLQKKIT